MLAAERYAGASPSRLRRVRKRGWEA
jgi:hypothetical protein